MNWKKLEVILLIIVVSIFFVLACYPVNAYEYPRYDLCTVDPMVVRITRCGQMQWIAGSSKTGWMAGYASWVDSTENRQAIMNRIFVDTYEQDKDLVHDYVYCDQ